MWPFELQKHSYLFEWLNRNKQIENSISGSIEMLIYTFIDCVAKFGNDKNNKFMYKYVDNFAYFEIASFYFFMSFVYLNVTYPEKRKVIIKSMLEPFHDIFSKATNYPEKHIEYALENRLTLYGQAFDGGANINFGSTPGKELLQHLIRMINYSKSTKAIYILKKIHPPAIILKRIPSFSEIEDNLYKLESIITYDYLRSLHYIAYDFDVNSDIVKS
jgi:hypothetical protein